MVHATQLGRLLVVMITMLLGSCAGGRDALHEIGLGPDPARKQPNVPAFVSDTRRGDLEYMPVGVSAPRRPTKAMSETAQKSLEADLAKARSGNEAKGKAARGMGSGVGRNLAAPVPSQSEMEKPGQR